MYARTYCPSQVERVLALWQARVADGAHAPTGGSAGTASSQSAKMAAALASPAAYPNLFAGFDEHSRAERYTRMLARQEIPAGDYPQLPPTAQRDVLQVWTNAAYVSKSVFSELLRSQILGISLLPK